MKFTCNLDTSLYFFSDKFQQTLNNQHLLQNQDPYTPDILSSKPPAITVLVPTGDSNKLEEIQRNTISLTIFGMAFILYEIVRKSKD